MEPIAKCNNCRYRVAIKNAIDPYSEDGELTPSEGITIARVNIEVRETGTDVDNALFKASKRIFGAGLVTLSIGVMRNAAKEIDQTVAIIKGIAGVISAFIGLYLIFSED